MHLCRTLKLALVAFPLLLPAAAADWPSFRGSPTMSGQAANLQPPLRKLWSVPVSGGVFSTAAIVGETVYVGTKGGDLLALRLSDGGVKWRYRGRDPISSSPCVAGGMVFFGDEGGVFRALKASNGRPVWKLPTGDKIVSSAAYVGGAVLFGSYDGHLYKLRAKTGKRIWAFKTKAQVHCSPSVVPGHVLIAGCDGNVRTLSLATGKQVRTIEVGGNFSACIASDGVRGFVGNLGGVYLGLNVKTGKELWRVQEQESGAASYGGGAVKGNTVVFASRSKRVFAVDARTGRAKWTYRTRLGVDSSPVIAGEVVYFGCDDGYLTALNLGNGKRLWRQRLGGAVDASPAISQGRLVIGTESGRLMCFGR